MGKSVDPSRAITEEEPWAIAQQTGKGLSNLRHKDIYGQEIADPDRSNPTRHRMERPLDTIRSFEKAIYNDERELYPRKPNKHGSTYEPQNSQRASVAYQYGDQSARHSTYDNGSTYSHRPNYQQRNSGYDNLAPSRPRVEQSDSHSGSYSNGGASGWSGEPPHSTNPSSDASAAYANYDPQQQYSRLPLGSDKPLPNVGRPSGNSPPMGYQNGYNPQQNGYGQQQQTPMYNGNNQFAPAQVQHRQSYGQGQPSWNSQPAASKSLAPTPSTASAKGEKRKSWFRRSKS